MLARVGAASGFKFQQNRRRDGEFGMHLGLHSPLVAENGGLLAIPNESTGEYSVQIKGLQEKRF